MSLNNKSLGAITGRPHSPREDIYGVALGLFFCAIGINFLSTGKMITGGVAGMALLTSLFLHKPVGSLIWLLNAPFVACAFLFMGKWFGAKTLIVSAILGSAVTFVGDSMMVSQINPAFSALAGGTLLGTGILFLARHNASLGGTGTVVLWIQRKYGVNAGIAQLGFDAALFLVASILLPWPILGWSLLGTIGMNAMIIVWHKPGRYMG